MLGSPGIEAGTSMSMVTLGGGGGQTQSSSSGEEKQVIERNCVGLKVKPAM